ncbi:MAG: recombinase RecA [Bacillales bacterium]|nr:recombinase RecA [Mollicutes bacterium]MCI7212936.1 recombinase RecA [Bacillales bacterium]MDD7714697.1 recombinase RecA [Mollicutes bacterium]MDY4936437.1 recombinase RecA [Candidatus Enteromonas sp.]
MANVNEKDKALEDALKCIEKAYGKGSVMRLGERPHVDVDVIPTGSILLDQALGVGGYPKGRIVEIYGPESSGKTTLALEAIAQAQLKGGRAAFIDAEHAIDPEYASKLGVDIDELILSQPDSGEQALEICEMLASSGAIDIIVVDSVAALVPQAELDGVMSDNQVGLQARLMSKGMRKIAGILNKTGTVVIFINQLREKVGVIYGNPETTTGGRALKFYASIRIDIRRAEAIKSGSDIVGNSVKVKIVKNKVAPPFKSCTIDMIFGQGISKTGELLDLGEEYNLLKKSGNWYEIDGNKIGNGREASKTYLKEHPEVAKDLEEKIKEKIKTE